MARLCPVSPMPSVMPVRLTVGGVVFSRIGPWFGIVANVGGWLTLMTVTLKLTVFVGLPPLAVPPSFVRVTKIVVVPVMKATGVKVSVPVVLGLT